MTKKTPDPEGAFSVKMSAAQLAICEVIRMMVLEAGDDPVESLGMLSAITGSILASAAQGMPDEDFAKAVAGIQRMIGWNAEAHRAIEKAEATAPGLPDVKVEGRA